MKYTASCNVISSSLDSSFSPSSSLSNLFLNMCLTYEAICRFVLSFSISGPCVLKFQKFSKWNLLSDLRMVLLINSAFKGCGFHFYSIFLAFYFFSFGVAAFLFDFGVSTVISGILGNFTEMGDTSTSLQLFLIQLSC